MLAYALGCQRTERIWKYVAAAAADNWTMYPMWWEREVGGGGDGGE